MNDILKELYRSVQEDFTPQKRSLKDLKVLFQKIYQLLDAISGLSFDPFKKLDSELGVSRTVIERNLLDLENQSNLSTGSLKSKGLEKLIYNLEMFDAAATALIHTNAPFGTEIRVAGALTGQLVYILSVSRDIITRIKKERIKEKITLEKTKPDRINYLSGELIYYKQNKDSIDEFQYEKITEFLELELQKWNSFIGDGEELYFHSNEDLLQYINEVIENKLVHNIRFQEGYRSFWRDEKSTQEPRKEPEVQPFIKTILEPYCSTRNIKIHREASSANGQIDFTFSYLNYSVCLEVKKAHHDNVEKGISNQLKTYMDSERSKFGIYLILWYKSVNGYSKPTKYNSIKQLTTAVYRNVPEGYHILVKVIDCSKPTSPSNL